MKVIILNTLYFPLEAGGAERSIKLLCDYLAKNYVVEVVSLKPSRFHRIEAMTLKKVVGDVTTHRFSLANIYWPFSGKRRNFVLRIIWHTLDIFNVVALIQVYKLVRRIKPDVVITNNLRGFSVAVWVGVKAAKVPLIHVSRDYYLASAGGSSGAQSWFPIRIYSCCRMLIMKRFSKLVDGYIGISNYIHDYHISRGFFSKAQSVIIYNQMDLSHPLSRRAESREIVFGYLGGEAEDKGWRHLQRIFNAESKSGHKLLAAGRYSGQVINSYKAHAFIDILGHVEINSFFSKIDVLLVPSEWPEPFGRVVIEGISRSVPVICSGKGGLLELANIFDSVSVTNFDEISASSEFIPLVESVKKIDIDRLDKFTTKFIGQRYMKFISQIVD